MYLYLLAKIFVRAMEWYNKLMQDTPQVGWTFKPGDKPNPQPGTAQATASPESSPVAQPTAELTWTASEFVAHEKSTGWYVEVGLASLLGIAIIYIITRDIFSVVVLVLFAITFLVFASRKPKVLQYGLNDRLIQVGQKTYPLASFKSFAVVDEGAIHSIALLPLKRFMPAMTMYYAPDDEAKIVNFLGQHLPQEERKQDAIDRLMRQIRF
jgi:hypothetical protein